MLPVEPGQGGKKPPNPKLVRAVFIGLIVAGILLAWSKFSDDEPKEKRAEPAKKEDSVARRPAIDVQGVSKEGYAVEIEKRVTEMSQTMNKFVTNVEGFKQEVTGKLSEMNNRIDQKYGELADKISNTLYESDKAMRRGASAAGTPLPPPLMGSPLAPSTSAAGAGVSPIAYVSFGGAAAPPPSKDLFNIGKDAKEVIDKTVEKQDANLRQAAGITAPAVVAAPKTRKEEIAAGTRVHVTNLHAADCPTGSQSVPIVLPATSELRGPNGNTIDLGAPHFIAKCVGLENKVDGNKSRARILVERLSYVGSDGKVQTVKVEGYIVDRRDSAQDIEGIYESKQGEALAKSAAAAGIAAIGNLTSSAEFTSIAGAGAGTTTSSLTGSPGKAALGAAVGAAAERVANFYLAQVEARVPIVHIDAALPMTVMLTTPFTIEVPREDSQHAALY